MGREFSELVLCNACKGELAAEMTQSVDSMRQRRRDDGQKPGYFSR